MDIKKYVVKKFYLAFLEYMQVSVCAYFFIYIENAFVSTLIEVVLRNFYVIFHEF